MTPPTQPDDATPPAERGAMVTVHFAPVDGTMSLVQVVVAGPAGTMGNATTVASIQAALAALSEGTSAPEVREPAGDVADQAPLQTGLRPGSSPAPSVDLPGSAALTTPPVAVTANFALGDGAPRVSGATATGSVDAMADPRTVAAIWSAMAALSGGTGEAEVRGAAGDVAEHTLLRWIKKSPTRHRLVAHLRTAKGLLTNTELAEQLRTPAATLHKPLVALCREEIVVRTENGANPLYSLNPSYRGLAERLDQVETALDRADWDDLFGETLTAGQKDRLTWIAKSTARCAVVRHLLPEGAAHTASWLGRETGFGPAAMTRALVQMNRYGVVDLDVPVAADRRSQPGEVFCSLRTGFRATAVLFMTAIDRGIDAPAGPISDDQVTAMRIVFGDRMRLSIMQCLAASRRGTLTFTQLKKSCQVGSGAVRVFTDHLRWLETNELVRSIPFGTGGRWSIRPEVMPYLNGVPVPDPEGAGPPSPS